MKKQVKLYLLIIGFISCENALLDEEIESTDPYVNFEYLWNQCNEKYTYFDLKNVDWVAVKKEYRAKIFHGISQDSLFTVFGAMLNELKDDHVNLVSDFKTSFYGRKYLEQDNFNWRILVDQYISTSYTITGPFAHNFIADKQIGYVRLSTFSEIIEEEYLDYILTKYKDTDGMIIDLRENGGGKIENQYILLRRLIEKETVVQYTRIKSGPGHQNFSSPRPVRVTPYKGIRYTKNIVVLIDGGTFSSASLFALHTKAFHHITLVGDKTGGGLGMPNGGQLPNGWFYRFSVTQSLDLQQKPDYENGVPPDIPMFLDTADLSKDEIVEVGMIQLL